MNPTQTKCPHSKCGRRGPDILLASGDVILLDTCRKCKRPFFIKIEAGKVTTEAEKRAPALVG